jgi:hypothetical protein
VPLYNTAVQEAFIGPVIDSPNKNPLSLPASSFFSPHFFASALDPDEIEIPYDRSHSTAQS